MGIKQKAKIQKPCTNCFAPQYLKFNFSYIVYEENFEKQYQLQFLKRIRELSTDTYNIIRNRDKKNRIRVYRNKRTKNKKRNSSKV